MYVTTKISNSSSTRVTQFLFTRTGYPGFAGESNNTSGLIVVFSMVGLVDLSRVGVEGNEL